MKRYGFGIIGCGMIGDVHARAITASENVELVGVYDNEPARSRGFAQKYSTKAYPDIAALLQDGEIDAVAICTPSGMHAEQAIAAIKAGKHVMLEKPMALTARDCERIIEALEGTPLKLAVAFQSRTDGDIHYAKELVDRGELGRITVADLYMKYWRDEGYFKASPWRGTFAMDGGGALMNQGIHGVDLMHYLLGAPRLIGAKVKTLVHNIETEDTALALVEYPSGALGVIEAATSANPGFDRRIEIHGSRGSVTIVDTKISRLVIDGEVRIEREGVGDAGTASNPGGLGHEKHLSLYGDFIDAIEKDRDPISTANDGYLSVKLIEDVYRRSKEG